MRNLCYFLVGVLLSGCGGNVSNTVLQDFGIQDRPDDYVSGVDRVMTSMQTVGATELKRLNSANRHGEIKYEETDALHGKFFKEIRVYTKAYPLDAQPVGRQGNRKERGFVGVIDYAYELRESPRFSNRTQAAAANATIPGSRGGRDRFRYRFTSSGTWDGAKGEATR